MIPARVYFCLTAILSSASCVMCEVGVDVALAAGQTGRGYNQGAAGWLTGRRLPPHGEHQPTPT